MPVSKSKRAPRPEKLPGSVKSRPARGKTGDRPLERIKRGFPPQRPRSDRQD